MAEDPGGITELLQQWRTGDREAESRLFELLMPDLRRIAARCFRGERSGHTLQPTALVNEAFFRLARAKNIDWQDRGHFFAIAAVMMRRLLIDHARRQPDAELLPIEGLPEGRFANETPLEQAIAIDAALEELGRESPQQRRVVELKFSLGLTDEEAAEALNLKLRSLQREWHRARKWLFERLTATPGTSAVPPRNLGTRWHTASTTQPQTAEAIRVTSLATSPSNPVCATNFQLSL